MLTSAASSTSAATSAMVSGILTATILVTVLLFAVLILREFAVLSDKDADRILRPTNAVFLPLAIAFVLNLGANAVVALG